MCHNENDGWDEKTRPRSPLLLGGGARGGGEKYGHNLFIINFLSNGRTLFFSTTPNPSSQEEGTTDRVFSSHPPLGRPCLGRYAHCFYQPGGGRCARTPGYRTKTPSASLCLLGNTLGPSGRFQPPQPEKLKQKFVFSRGFL